MPTSVSTDRKVLFVDDDGDLCDAMTEALEDEGFVPICATGDQYAEEALRLHKAVFAALVIDINLGRGTTGFDVARSARSLNSRVPVLFISGVPDPRLDRFGVPRAGFLPKPFAPDELIAAIRKLISAA